MNKLLTYAGTQPIYLGDIDFVQNAALDVFKNIAKALMNLPSDTLNAIIQGVELTYPSSGTVSWTAGVVVLNGEILPIAAGSITVGNDDAIYFHVVSTLSGERTFKDGESRKCYDTRSALISTESTNGIAYETVPRLHLASDDAIYTAFRVTAGITDARIIAKSGIYYLEFSVDTDGSTQRIGEMSISIKKKYGESIPFLNYSDSIILLNSNNEYVVAPIQIYESPYLSGEEATLLFTISFRNSPIAGSGKFHAVLPLF